MNPKFPFAVKVFYTSLFDGQVTKGTRYSAGVDIALPADLRVAPRAFAKKVGLGVRMQMVVCADGKSAYPIPFYLIPRSSTANKHNLVQANSIGLIDADYTGELIWCCSDGTHDLGSFVEKGTRLVQAVPLNGMSILDIARVDSIRDFPFDMTKYEHGGFGSTGD